MADANLVYDAWVAIHQAAVMLERAADVRLRPWNLSASHAAALAALVEHGPQRMSDLARYLLQQTQTTTDLVDRLERRGLVRRIRHASDRRVVLVEATDEGQQLLSSIEREGSSVGQDTLGQLTDEALSGLSARLRGVRDQAATIAGVPVEHLGYAEQRLRLSRTVIHRDDPTATAQ